MQNTDWHLMDAEDVVRAFSSDMYTGLPEKKRRGRGRNRVWYVQRTSAGEYALACLSDLATVLLVITALFAAVFEGGVSAILLCGLLLLGAVLRVATYVKARRILEACAAETSPTASVLRDGRLVLLRAEDVVPGDIVFLESGDTVVADGRMIAGDEIALSERGITANRDTVHKTPATIRILHRDGAETAEGGEIPAEYRANMLYAGATVLFGSGRMIVTATGKNTLICHKQGGIPLSSGEKLPFMDALSRFCQLSSLCMLALVLVFTLIALFCGTGFSRVFLVTMAMAVASMSEFLPALAYSMIAISVRDCGESIGGGKSGAESGRRGAVITNIAAIEDLSRVKRLVFSDMDLFRSGNESLHAFWSGGALHAYNAESAGMATELLQLLLATVGAESTHTALSGGATTALSKKYRTLAHAADFHAKMTGQTLTHAFFAMDRADGRRAGGLDTVLLSDHGTVWAVVSGGIREVMQCAVTYFDGEKAVPMTEETRRSIFTEAARLTVMGGYVVACARRLSPYTTLNRLPLLQSNLCFMGFAAMVTPPEEGTRELLAELRRSGFSVVVLSEDTELDLYYGREIGLFTKHSPVYPMEQTAPYPLPLVVRNGTDRAENCLVAVPEVMTASLGQNVNRASIRYERLRALFAATKRREEAVTARLAAEKERYLAQEAAWKAKNRRFFRELEPLDAEETDEAARIAETKAGAESTADADPAKPAGSADEAESTGAAAKSGRSERPIKPSGKTPLYGESAVICRNVLDARLLSTGDIGIAVGATPNRPIPQPLKAKADAVAYPPAGHGGIAEVVEILCAARRAMVRIHAAAVYLMTSQAARFVFAAVCASFGGHFHASLPTPAVILTWGLILDFVAALTMAFRKPGSVGEMLSCTVSELGLPGKRDVLLFAPIVGLVWGGSCAALYPLLSLVTTADPVGIVTAAMYLCQCAAAGEMAVKKGIFARFHVASGLFALCSLALFWHSLAAFTGSAWCMGFAVAPAILVWGMLRLMKRVF